MDRKFLIVSFLLLSGGAGAFSYLVQKGDTLSGIAKKHSAGPVWGKDGSLKRILSLNPHIEDPNLIYYGQGLQLPEEVPPEVAVIRNVSSIEETSTERMRSSGLLVLASSRKYSFEFTPYYKMLSLDLQDRVTGAKSVLATKLYTGVDAAYFQHWKPDFKTFIHLNLGWVTFEAPANNEKTITRTDGAMSGIGIGGVYDFTKRLNLTLTADYQKELFARSLSTTEVTVDKVAIPSVGGKLSWDFVTLDPFVLGLSGLYESKFQAKADSYRIHQGEVWGGSLYLKQLQVGERRGFQTELGYKVRSQDTGLVKQAEADLTLGVRFSFD